MQQKRLTEKLPSENLSDSLFSTNYNKNFCCCKDGEDHALARAMLEHATQNCGRRVACCMCGIGSRIPRKTNPGRGPSAQVDKKRAFR